jgi:hypothetical protein
MNSYELSRSWYDFAFENPSKIKPYHSAIYFFAIEHCNRLGWKKEFGFPTSMVLEAIGMRSYNSYKKYFDELVDFGFIKVHEYSKNQYSANIIELSLNNKALDKALQKHSTKQGQSIVSIDKQLTSKQLNNKTIEERKADFKKSLTPFLETYDKSLLNDFYLYWTEHGEKDKKMRFEKQKSFAINLRLARWKGYEKKYAKNGTENLTATEKLNKALGL